jgi:hypothetical protein
MEKLRATGFSFTGLYLVAPSHPNAGWLGHRAPLAAQGWGFCVTFVGQETVGPGAHNVTAAQGTIDGQRAAAQMASEGFPAGSRVYLDLENGPPFGFLEAGYVEAWVAEVEVDGWASGVYVSHLLAAQVAALCPPSTAIWAVHIPFVGGRGSPPWPTPDLAECGYPAAAVWQRAQDVMVKVGATTLQLDLDVSTMANPSAP